MFFSSSVSTLDNKSITQSLLAALVQFSPVFDASSNIEGMCITRLFHDLQNVR